MSTPSFSHALSEARFSKNDQKWFPVWWRRFREFADQHFSAEQQRLLFQHHRELPSGKASGRVQAQRRLMNAMVLRSFRRMLKDSGCPAFQRKQAVQAVVTWFSKMARFQIVGAGEVLQALDRQASVEKQLGPNERPDEIETAALVGQIDPDEPPIIQELRREMRVRGLAARTEKAYAGWVKRFLFEFAKCADVFDASLSRSPEAWARTLGCPQTRSATTG